MDLVGENQQSDGDHQEAADNGYNIEVSINPSE